LTARVDPGAFGAELNVRGAAHVRHEADVLSSTRHPGIVEVVTCKPDVGGVVLRTEFVGGHSLDTVGPLELERAAGLVAALADVVADLHDLGVVHGRIEPAHILIGTGGRPILCGFGGGGRVGTTPPPGPPATSGFVDPAASSDAALFPHLDVYGLGCVLRALLGDSSHDLEPIPDRRFTMDRLRATWTGFHRRALLTLADRATDDLPSRRPPARRFARELLDAVPSASLGDRATPNTRANVALPHSRRTRLALLAVLAVVLTGVGERAARAVHAITAVTPYIFFGARAVEFVAAGFEVGVGRRLVQDGQKGLGGHIHALPGVRSKIESRRQFRRPAIAAGAVRW